MIQLLKFIVFSTYFHWYKSKLMKVSCFSSNYSAFYAFLYYLIGFVIVLNTFEYLLHFFSLSTIIFYLLIFLALKEKNNNRDQNHNLDQISLWSSLKVEEKHMISSLQMGFWSMARGTFTLRAHLTICLSKH